MTDNAIPVEEQAKVHVIYPILTDCDGPNRSEYQVCRSVLTAIGPAIHYAKRYKMWCKEVDGFLLGENGVVVDSRTTIPHEEWEQWKAEHPDYRFNPIAEIRAAFEGVVLPY